MPAVVHCLYKLAETVTKATSHDYSASATKPADVKQDPRDPKAFNKSNSTANMAPPTSKGASLVVSPPVKSVSATDVRSLSRSSSEGVINPVPVWRKEAPLDFSRKDLTYASRLQGTQAFSLIYLTLDRCFILE